MKVFDYEDVQLIPNKCIVNSRSECDTTVILGKHAFKMPIVPANMQTIINEPIAEFLAENGYFYIMHRFNGSARIPSLFSLHLVGSFFLYNASLHHLNLKGIYFVIQHAVIHLCFFACCLFRVFYLASLC